MNDDDTISANDPEKSYKIEEKEPPRTLPGPNGNLNYPISQPPIKRKISFTKNIKRRVLYGLILVLLVIGVAYGVKLYHFYLNHETTDNAQVEGRIITISPRTAGVVEKVLVDVNQRVKADQLLVQLNTRPLAIEVEQAKAAVEVIKAKLASARLSVPLEQNRTDAKITEARAQAEAMRKSLATAQAELTRIEKETLGYKAQMEKAELDRRRLEQLHAKGVIPQQQLDAAISDYNVARSNYEASLASQRVAAAKIESLKNQIKQTEAQIVLAQTGHTETEMKGQEAKSLEAELAQAEANLDAALLRLSYTEIRAPVDGIIGKRSVEVGERVNVGQPLMALIPDEVWIVANLKETQLEYVRVGQPVEFTVDAYPGKVFKGKVESISPATGAKFSLLPPDNATGNFTKVVQRVPVRITIEGDPEYPIRPGMSVFVTIDISSARAK
ncbi:MAG TPA: HlyD family secretion protein [Candidatus Limnocylindrales bacterium]|nr:HlyD family secretion protein [Candidatus Limnocylindrales bacterium]